MGKETAVSDRVPERFALFLRIRLCVKCTSARIHAVMSDW